MTTQDTAATKVGFIGLGLMGYPMAKNLASSGCSLTVMNRSPEKPRRLAEETGCSIAEDLSDFAGCDVVFTMLPGPPEVEKVTQELIPVLSPDSIVIDTSTSSPPLARELAELGQEYELHVLDSPVSGGDVGAVEGTLSIMVGGEKSAFERAKPLFDALGKTVTHVGEAGTGQTVKAANQTVVALTILAVSEALTLARRGGVDAEIVLDVLGGGLAANGVMKVKREKFLTGDFTPGGRVASQHKDLGIVLETARELGVFMPATAVCKQLYGSLMARDMRDLDHSALIKVIEELSGDGTH